MIRVMMIIMIICLSTCLPVGEDPKPYEDDFSYVSFTIWGNRGPHRETPLPEVRFNTFDSYKLQWIISALCVLSKLAHLIWSIQFKCIIHNYWALGVNWHILSIQVTFVNHNYWAPGNKKSYFIQFVIHNCYIYIYIYINRERETEIDNYWGWV